MWSYFLFFSIILSSLYLGVLVYYKNPRARDNKLFFFFIFWLIIWLIASYFENEEIFFQARKLFLKIDFITALTLGYFFYLFCYFFSEEKKLSKIRKIILVLLLLLMNSLIIAGALTRDVFIENGAIKFKESIVFPFYILLMLYYYFGGLWQLFIKIRKIKGAKKNQILYILIGFLLSVFISLGINLFFQNFLTVELFRIGNYAIMFLVLFTSYAIIRHRLFDIRSIIQRGLIYSGLLSIIVGFYLVLIFIFGIIFQQATKEITISLAALATTILGIYSVPIIERFFRKITDKIFFKDKYDYKEAVYELSEIFNKNLNLEILLKKFSKKFTKILRVKFVRIILPQKKKIFDEYEQFRNIKTDFNDSLIKTIEEENLDIFVVSSPWATDKLKKGEQSGNKIKLLQLAKKEGKKYGIAIFAPVFINKKLIGLILLGEKKSGDIYTSEDFNLIRTISSQMAVALEKAQLYKQVKDYSKELEEKVRKRTAKIEGLQKEQMQMMHEVSHGLQTPLTILKGELSLLKNEIKDNKKILSLERSIDRISKFIYDMLRLARLEAKGRKIKKEIINFSDLLEELSESFKIITQEKNISIIHAIDPGIYINGDKNQLDELMMNLVSNSVKYMSQYGDKKIEILLKRNGARAELNIIDTGIGMNAENLSKVFKRFYRIKDEKGIITSGTGLGLAICKEIVENHNGSIKIKSEVNIGTKVIIIFPLAK